jgi:hypothetical protein
MSSLWSDISLVLVTTLAASRVMSAEDSGWCSPGIDDRRSGGGDVMGGPVCMREDVWVCLHHVRAPLVMCLTGLGLVYTPDVLLRESNRQLKAASVRILMLGIVCYWSDFLWRSLPAFAYVQSLHISVYILSLSSDQSSLGVRLDSTIRVGFILGVLGYAWLYGPAVPVIDLFCRPGRYGHCGSIAHLFAVLSPLHWVDPVIQDMVGGVISRRCGGLDHDNDDDSSNRVRYVKMRKYG